MASKKSQRAGLALVYAVSLAIGVVTGVRSRGRIEPTPTAKLGFALEQAELQGTPEAHQRLARVAETVRASWKEDRDVLDLVLTVRGIGTGGEADLQRAGTQCKALGWPRCDAPAMKELQARSRP